MGFRGASSLESPHPPFRYVRRRGDKRLRYLGASPASPGRTPPANHRQNLHLTSIAPSDATDCIGCKLQSIHSRARWIGYVSPWAGESWARNHCNSRLAQKDSALGRS